MNGWLQRYADYLADEHARMWQLPPHDAVGLPQFLPSTWHEHRDPTPELTPAVPALLRDAQRRWRVPQRPESGTLPA